MAASKLYSRHSVLLGGRAILCCCEYLDQSGQAIVFIPLTILISLRPHKTRATWLCAVCAAWSGLCAATWYDEGSGWKDLEEGGCSLNQARVLCPNLPLEAEEIHERMILLIRQQTDITKWHPQFWEVSFNELPITGQVGWSGNSPELYYGGASFECR